MSKSPFEKWRQLRSETQRFDVAISRYRHLLETGTDTGYAEKSSLLDKAALQGDPKKDAQLKKKIEKRNFEAKKSRFDALDRIRELSALDIGMIGGTSPVGSMGGSGGGDGPRPTSISPRS